MPYKKPDRSYVYRILCQDYRTAFLQEINLEGKAVNPPEGKLPKTVLVVVYLWCFTKRQLQQCS